MLDIFINAFIYLNIIYYTMMMTKKKLKEITPEITAKDINGKVPISGDIIFFYTAGHDFWEVLDNMNIRMLNGTFCFSVLYDSSSTILPFCIVSNKKNFSQFIQYILEYDKPFHLKDLTINYKQ